MKFLLFVLVICLLSMVLVSSQEEVEEDVSRKKLRSGKRNKMRKGKKKENPIKLAIQTFIDSITEKDYDYENWKVAYHSNNAADFFNAYAKKISDIFKKHKAKVNFAMIGMPLCSLNFMNQID